MKTIIELFDIDVFIQIDLFIYQNILATLAKIFEASVYILSVKINRIGKRIFVLTVFYAMKEGLRKY